jgi:lysyl-tRNA synthetase class 2
MQTPEHTESELLHFRREKLEGLKQRGIDPFGRQFETTHEPGRLKASFADGIQTRLAGRILSRREMGKASFFDLGGL